MNKNRSIRTQIVCWAIAFALLCACTPKEPSTAQTAIQTAEAAADTTPAQSVTLTDMAGREVTLERPATRIVALAAGDCEILYAIGAGETLIGRGEYCNYPEAVAAVPAVQTGSETNIEQILALEPEVVVLNTMAQTLEQVEALEQAGIQTVASKAEDIAGAYETIHILGTLTGHEAEAEALVMQMQGTLTALAVQAEKLAPSGVKKRIYFEVSPLAYGLWTAGDGTFMNEIAGILGLQNAFSDVTGWAEISEEQVLQRNPDYIVTIAMVSDSGPAPEEEILSRPGWQTVTAVQNGSVYLAASDAMARPGPRLVTAAQELFDFVYGAAAQDAAA